MLQILCCYIRVREDLSILVTSSRRAKSCHFQPISRARSHGLSGLEEFTVLSGPVQPSTAFPLRGADFYTLSGRPNWSWKHIVHFYSNARGKVLHMGRFMFDFLPLGEFFSLAFLMVAIYRSLLSLDISGFLIADYWLFFGFIDIQIFSSTTRIYNKSFCLVHGIK